MNPLADPKIQETFKGVFGLVAPEIALLACASCIFLFGSLYNRRWLWFVVSALGVVIAITLATTIKTTLPPLLTAAPIIPDAAAGFIRWVALATAVILLLVSWPEVSRSIAAEYYGCLLVAAAGVSLVGRANDLITLFLALELISIPTYILLYLPGRTKFNQEAAAKYFFLSIMSSALLLFGFSYLYGLTGSTNLTVIVDALTKANTEIPTDASASPDALAPLSLLAIVLVVAAMCFRITAVPFHFYAPDVYEGAPAGVVAQLAFLPKVAGFVALSRLLGLIGPDMPHLMGDQAIHLPFDANTQLPLLLWILAILTMTLGNILALLQDNIRRLLAYSSVAHAGYMLIGVIVACGAATGSSVGGGMSGLLVYLVAYGMMTIGSFAVILLLSTADRPIEAIDDLAGLSRTHPITALTMTIFMFSLIGLPLTAGFVGKFLLFLSAFSAPSDTPAMRNLYQLLAVFGAVNAAVGAIYYLRVVGVIYLRTPLRPVTGSRAVPTFIATLVLAAGTIVVGVYPQPLVEAARKATGVSHVPAKDSAPAS